MLSYAFYQSKMLLEICQCVLYVLVLYLINAVFLGYSTRHMFDIAIFCSSF